MINKGTTDRRRGVHNERMMDGWMDEQAAEDWKQMEEPTDGDRASGKAFCGVRWRDEGCRTWRATVKKVRDCRAAPFCQNVV